MGGGRGGHMGGGNFVRMGAPPRPAGSVRGGAAGSSILYVKTLTGKTV